MSTIGRFAVLVVLAGAAVAAVVGIRSIPDIQRYLRIRQM